MTDAQTVETIDEVDLLRLKLLNRDIDLLETQMQLAQTALQVKKGELQMMSMELAKKYNIENANIDPTTGQIIRGETAPPAVVAPAEEKNDAPDA